MSASRPQYPPHNQGTPRDRPVSPAPPNPWDFLVTKKTAPCEVLTKRELFAAMAMQGIMSNPQGWEMSNTDVASMAVELSDALIAELSKGTES